jgi:hypothetical protein
VIFIILNTTTFDKKKKRRPSDDEFSPMGAVLIDFILERKN